MGPPSTKVGPVIGFLSSLFTKDWPAELDRAEELLERDEALRALEIAERARRRTEGDVEHRAVALVERAREELVDSLLEKADDAEAEGDFADAADWLLAAIERLEDDPRLDELETRREELLARAEDRDNPYLRSDDGGSTPDSAHLETGVDARYEALVSMLDDEVARRYEDRPEEFRQAVGDLNEGRAEAAREILDRLLEKAPDDAILRLERGRALLLVDEYGAARRDLEHAWEELGSGPLDITDSLSVPRLWAEASLADEKPRAVVERLEELADPAAGRTEICHLYAMALVQTGSAEETLDYLATASAAFPRDPRFSLVLARLLASRERTDEAIAVLEASVAPMCTTRSCSKGSVHAPSLRALADLYIETDRKLDEAAALMARIAQSRGGTLGAADHAVLGRYYRATGDAEAAAVSEAEAERLADTGEEGSAAPPRLGTGRRVIF